MNNKIKDLKRQINILEMVQADLREEYKENGRETVNYTFNEIELNSLKRDLEKLESKAV